MSSNTCAQSDMYPEPLNPKEYMICSGCPGGWCYGCIPDESVLFPNPETELAPTEEIEPEPLSKEEIQALDDWERDLQAGWDADHHGIIRNF